MLLRKCFVVVLLIAAQKAFTQQMVLGKNPYAMNKSAVLELNADNQGLLLPRISDTASINALNPPDGMVIYFVPTKRLLLRTLGYWSTLAPSNSSIGVATGTTGTDVNVSGSPVALGSTVTLNIPSASATARGVLTNTDWNTFNSKQAALTFGNLTTTTSGVTVTGGTGSVIGGGAAVNIQNATSLQTGLLTFADWNTFNSKVGTTRTISTTAPLSGGGDLSANRTISMTQANATTNGWLSFVDWNTFNNKQAAGNYVTGLSGDVSATGPGTVAATISNNAVTAAKFRQSAASSLVGNATGVAANVTDITLGAGLSFSGNTLVNTITNNNQLTNGAGYITSSGTATSFSGSLAGDVTGTQAATTVVKINGTSLAGLATGILKNTTGTGVPSIAVAADFPTLNQNTTGSAASVSGSNVITNSNLAQMPATTLKANPTGVTANAQDITLGAGLAFSGSTLVNTITNTNQLANGAGYITAANVVFSNQANTYTAGMKQSFRGSTTSAGFALNGGLTADPTTLATGDIWYRADVGKLRYYDGSTARYLATEGVSISGTQNYLSKFSATGTTLGNSLLYDDGTKVGLGTTVPTATLHVKAASNPVRLEGLQQLQSNNVMVVDANGNLGYTNTLQLTFFAKGTFTIDLPNISNNSNIAFAVSVPGAKVGDNVIVTPSGEMTGASGGLITIGYSYVSANDQVTIRFVNPTNTNTDVPSMIFYISVLR